MGDNWDEEDWESETFKPVLPAAPVAKAGDFDTKGQAILAAIDQPDMSKFADEDQEEEDEPKYNVVKPQPKKKEEKKYDKGGPVDQPLDDPIAEKLRQQRLVEQADYQAAQELFGTAGNVDLHAFLPKTAKDFDDFAAALASRYILVHADNKNFKAFIKSLVKHACTTLTAAETKDVETSVAGLRAEKLKAEQAAAAAKAKAGKKSNLNVGKSGGAAGLDDYQYDDDVGDDYDFM